MLWEPASAVRPSGLNAAEVRPLAWPLSYRFPVHRIGKFFQPGGAPADPTHLLVYRNRQDEVRFMTLNDVTRLLIDVLGDDSADSGRASLLRVEIGRASCRERV